MTPPECKTCGKRTDLSDMHGHSRCWACRRRLYPGVYLESQDERVRKAPVVNAQEAML